MSAEYTYRHLATNDDHTTHAGHSPSQVMRSSIVDACIARMSGVFEWLESSLPVSRSFAVRNRKKQLNKADIPLPAYKKGVTSLQSLNLCRIAGQ